MAQTGPTLPPRDAFARLIEGLQTFIREHLALARAEAKDELRTLGKNLALSAAGVPFLAAGYLLLMVAAALALALLLPQWAAFLVVAAVNLGAGAALTVSMGRKVARERVKLPATAQELRRDKQWVSQLKDATDAAPQPLAAPHYATTEVKHG